MGGTGTGGKPPSIGGSQRGDHSHNVGSEDLRPGLVGREQQGVEHGYPGNLVGPNHPMFSDEGKDVSSLNQKLEHQGEASSFLPPKEARKDFFGPPGSGLEKNIDPNPDQLNKPFFRSPEEKPNT